MEIAVGERKSYLKALRRRYGEEVANEQDLDGNRQQFFEMRRHQWNARLEAAMGDHELDPKRLLITVTRKCTFHCPHCWVFGSPSAVVSLDCGAFEAIERNLPPDQATSWTLSGGEVFALPDHAEMLANHPVQCIYTNGFWGEPADRCCTIIRSITRALRQNARIDKARFTLIISYDRYHRIGSGGRIALPEAIARIIAALYEEMSEVNLRISQTVLGGEEDSYLAIFQVLRQMGYQVENTAHTTSNGNVQTCSLWYRHGLGPTKEIFVDRFPLSLVSRALITDAATSGLPSTTEDPLPFDEVMPGPPLARYQYTIGPDGGVGLYEILHAPPVPYQAGNLVRESWRCIAERLRRDPIVLTLRRAGSAPIIAFMKIHYPELLKALLRDYQTPQQLLYLILLSPLRRLFLNTYLLATVGEHDLCKTIGEEMRQTLAAIGAISQESDRAQALARHYEAV